MESSWYSKALCRGKETGSFFPDPTVSNMNEQIRKLKSLCAACPVRIDCLSTAIKHNEEFGVWGGYSTRERKKIIKQYGRDVGKVQLKMVITSGNKI
jgi:WhiB family redox-sensing transcriptional regulator